MDGVANPNSRIGMASFTPITNDSNHKYIAIVEDSVNLNATNPRALCIQYFYCDNLANGTLNATTPITILLPKVNNRRGAPYVTSLPDGRIAIVFMSSQEYYGYDRGATSTYTRVIDMYISKIPITYGMELTDNLFAKCDFFDFGENQWGRWPAIECIDDKLYRTFTFGVNTSASAATRYGNVIISTM